MAGYGRALLSPARRMVLLVSRFPAGEFRERVARARELMRSRGVADKAAGDIKGQGINQFGAKWYLLAPSGNKIDTD